MRFKPTTSGFLTTVTLTLMYYVLLCIIILPRERNLQFGKAKKRLVFLFMKHQPKVFIHEVLQIIDKLCFDHAWQCTNLRWIVDGDPEAFINLGCSIKKSGLTNYYFLIFLIYIIIIIVSLIKVGIGRHFEKKMLFEGWHDFFRNYKKLANLLSNTCKKVPFLKKALYLQNGKSIKNAFFSKNFFFLAGSKGEKNPGSGQVSWWFLTRFGFLGHKIDLRPGTKHLASRRCGWMWWSFQLHAIYFRSFIFNWFNSFSLSQKINPANQVFPEKAVECESLCSFEFWRLNSN